MLWTFGLILLGVSPLAAGVHHVERPDAMEVCFLADVDRTAWLACSIETRRLKMVSRGIDNRAAGMIIDSVSV